VTTPVRPAELHEARDLADLWLRSRRASFPSIPPAVHSDDEVRRWFEEVVLPLREVWVAERALRPMALMVLHGADVDQLYVDPSCTGHGLGGALLQHAKVRRPAGLTLWTFQSNLGARRFYERHGFVAVATTDDNEERAPAVRYEWRPAP
jgi:GNAT superfamily N-acetyltransferase